MRLIPLAIAAAATAVLSTVPASAAWKEFKYEDLGVVKEFPGDPKIEKTEYKTPIVGTVPATVLTVTDDNIVYRMMVADTQSKPELGGTIMGECVFMAEDAGEPVAEMTARVEPGARAVYGRMISVNLKDNKGRALTACFHTKGRLYKIEAIVLPEHGEPNSSQAIRFVNSLSFNMKGEGPAEAAEGGAAAPAAGGGRAGGGARGAAAGE
jgi:hypothetical protein